MEILTSVKRLYISFKSLVNDFVYSFGRSALLLLVEVPVRERGRIRVKNLRGRQILKGDSVFWISCLLEQTSVTNSLSGFRVV
jgi:hypothetical protein